MTSTEFNEKYKDYLEKGHYGADGMDEPEFLNWLDNKFQEFIKKPNFTYSQIKSKFNMGRFYCEGIEQSWIDEVERKIEEFI